MPDSTDIENLLFAGVDVGGTNIKIGILDGAGNQLAFTSIPTESDRGPADAMRRVVAALRELLERHQLDGQQLAAAGLGTPGTMDIGRGLILEPPNLPAWRNFPVRDALSRELDRPVAYANDANAAAFGEYWIGSAAGYDSMVMLTLGTGVGGGIIVFDQAVDGVNSHGSEVGHIIVDTRDTARTCSCGHVGHLEAYASATAVAARAVESAEQHPDSGLGQQLAAMGRLTALDVYQQAVDGDAIALELILETADFLAIGILNLAHLIDPDAILLGGAMDFGGAQSPIGQKFLARIRREIERLAFPVVSKNLKIEFAALGGRAGYVGAAGIARSMVCRSMTEAQSLDSNRSSLAVSDASSARQ